MKTIIAGSRKYENYEAVASVMDRCPWAVTEVVCGKARGADTLGETWGKCNQIKIEYFPAEWKTEDGGLNKAAGYNRNKQMAEYAEAAVVFWDGKSSGSKHMIDLSLEHGLHLLVVMI